MKKHTITGNELKLSLMAEDIVFKNKVRSILKEIAFRTVTEAEGDEDSKDIPAPSSDDLKSMDKLIDLFAKEIKKGAGEVKAIAQDETKVKAILDKTPELAPLEKAVEESFKRDASGKLIMKESITLMVAGIVAAIPKLISLFGKLVGGAGSFLGFLGFKKGEAKLKQWAEKIAHAGHAVHKGYIKVIAGALYYFVPGFAEFEEKTQLIMAEVVYMGIVAFFAWQAGVGAFEALKHANWVHFGIEGLMGAVKSGELAEFIATTIAKLVAPIAAA
jgi:hypothetical protein